MFTTVRLRIPKLRATPAGTAAAADILARQTAFRLTHGGDEEITLAPTRSGRPFTAPWLAAATRATVRDGKPAVEVRHPAARWLQLGTKAKGGKLDTMRPVRAKALSWVANGVRVFVKKAEFPARPFLRVTRDNAVELGRAMLGLKH